MMVARALFRGNWHFSDEHARQNRSERLLGAAMAPRVTRENGNALPRVRRKQDGAGSRSRRCVSNDLSLE